MWISICPMKNAQNGTIVIPVSSCHETARYSSSDMPLGIHAGRWGDCIYCYCLPSQYVIRNSICIHVKWILFAKSPNTHPLHPLSLTWLKQVKMDSSCLKGKRRLEISPVSHTSGISFWIRVGWYLVPMKPLASCILDRQIANSRIYVCVLYKQGWIRTFPAQLLQLKNYKNIFHNNYIFL